MKLAALMLAALAFVPAARAGTAIDLSSRMVVDGLAIDFVPDEALLTGLDNLGNPIEPPDDSRWGPGNDVRQLHVTWDKNHLYLAAEGTIWGNNLVVAIDVVPDRGLTTMYGLNSWNRNFNFSSDFAPDLLCATWDQNTAPRLLTHVTGLQVMDDVPGTIFYAGASFDQGNPDRAMDFAIPWNVVMLAQAGLGAVARDTTVEGVTGTFWFVPEGTTLRIAAFVTTGADGYSGPDSAPNNTSGMPDDPANLVLIDNYAILPIDLDENGLPDFGVSPSERVSYAHLTTPVARTSFGAVKHRYRDR